MPGVLYLCGTPIGNLEDMTLRLMRILKEADLIAAEDTRQTFKLLNHLEIQKPLISYHEHNKAAKGPELVEKLLEGQNIALVSDAGMPAISDPGEDLVKLCLQNEIEVIPVPGPSAAITALVVSGLSTERFCFEGFLPSNKNDRREKLNKLSEEERTMIFYEAPHRIIDTLQAIRDVLGNRNISVSRELTKKFEETLRGKAEEIIEILSNRSIKGEFVIVVEGIDPKEVIAKNTEKWHNISIEEHIEIYISQGLTKKEAISKVAKDRNLPKKEVYKYTI